MDNLMVLFGQFFALIQQPVVLFHAFWATGLGILMGMMPGLTATLALALMTGLTFGFPAQQAILVLICMYVGAIYGGSRAAILLNIPGTPANAATALDGFPLARAGRAGEAIGLATTASANGSFLGLIALALFTPLLAKIALQFGYWEFFWLAIFGVVICGQLTSSEPLKGWIAGFFGLLFSMVGIDSITAVQRFTLGQFELLGGFELIPVLVGAYGVSEVISVMKQTRPHEVNTTVNRVLPRIRDILHYWRTSLRSGIIGTTAGAIPGVGEDIAAWVAYNFAKRASKRPEEFGKGSQDGLVASETANNASVAGALIPVLTLAIPGSAPAAILIAALWLHGINPGPTIGTEFIFEVVAVFALATVFMLILGLSMVRPLVKVLQLPRGTLIPVIFALSVVGAFAVHIRLFDVYLMFFFGLLGFAMREMDFPIAPLVLGFILGPMADAELRRALAVTGGDITPFFTRPVSMFMVAIILLTVFSQNPYVQQAFQVIGQRVFGGFIPSGRGRGAGS